MSLICRACGSASAVKVEAAFVQAELKLPFLKHSSELFMNGLVIRFNSDQCNDVCALCQKTMDSKDGPRLYMADLTRAVCCNCGKRRAPSLAALLELAQAAQRAEHIGRNSR